MERRKFIKTTGTVASLFGLSSFASPITSSNNTCKVIVLHTADFEGNLSQFNNLKNTINKIKASNQNVLLFDCGDFIGSRLPSEEYYKYKKQLNYTAVCLGNKEVTNDIKLEQNLAIQNTPTLNSNYNFKNSQIQKYLKQYHTLHIGNIKIGVFGIGINTQTYSTTNKLEVSSEIDTAKKTAQYLKHIKHCDYIICLSHLGYKYATKKTCDITLNNRVPEIDLILGGHTHNKFEKVELFKGDLGEKLGINHVGSLGNTLGKIDLEFVNQKLTKISGKNINIPLFS